MYHSVLQFAHVSFCFAVLHLATWTVTICQWLDYTSTLAMCYLWCKLYLSSSSSDIPTSAGATAARDRTRLLLIPICRDVISRYTITYPIPKKVQITIVWLHTKKTTLCWAKHAWISSWLCVVFTHMHVPSCGLASPDQSRSALIISLISFLLNLTTLPVTASPILIGQDTY